MRDKQQIGIVSRLLSGLFALLLVIVVSAFWNEAGLINAIASFLLLGEPMIFLAAVASMTPTLVSLTKLKQFWWCSVLINFLLAAVQKPLIDSNLLYADGFNGTDGCGGVFFVSGAGNYVSASVSIAFALYFFCNEKKCAILIRILAMSAAF
ncbi:MAG: hypothetical protein AAGK10_21100, partial [Cyanobacteria bacterium J06555_3]